MEEVYVQRVESLVNYLELHITSLQQDYDELDNEAELLDIDEKAYEDIDIEMINISGQIFATQHILSVVNDTMVTWKREK